MIKSSFLQGAMILTIAGIVVKVLGGVNRILLSRLLGGEGIGLYQMAYPVYILLLSIVGAGIPIAVSIMVAEEAAKGNYKGTRHILHIVLSVMAVIAILSGAAMVWGARWLIDIGLVRDPRAYIPLIVLAPALVVSIMTCCFRGYFQGLQLMKPTAVSQMLDQFIRVVLMLSLAYFLLPHGLVPAVAGATFGAVPGAVAGLVVIVYLYYRHCRREPLKENLLAETLNSRQVIGRLFVLAVPVAAANMLLPAVASIDLFIVPRRLMDAGYSLSQATTSFGYLTGMANGLVQLPAILTMALATSLVPAVSAACSAKQHDVVMMRTHTAMRIANMITVPASLGLAVLAVPISVMLYATPSAGPAISVLAISVFLIGLQQITSGLIQGLGHTAIPLLNMAIAAVFKILLSWYLTAIPWLAEVGAAWATNVDLAIATALNLYFAWRYVRYRLHWFYLSKLFLAGAAMAGTAWFMFQVTSPILPHTISTLLSITLAGIVYIIGLFAFRAISKEDIRSVPVIGERLYGLVTRFGE